MEYSVNLALVAGTLVGAIANVLAVGLALRARRRRFMRTLDDEIRRAVWDYALVCSENGTSHSLSGFSPAEVRDYHLRMTKAARSLKRFMMPRWNSFKNRSRRDKNATGHRFLDGCWACSPTPTHIGITSSGAPTYASSLTMAK
jgi:hypothetical protein